MCLREESRLCNSEGEQPFICKQSRERRGWWGAERTGETTNRSRVNETISKKRGNREARDQNKGGKERGNPTSRGREKGRSEWVERQATRARRSQAVPQVRSWENRNARLRSSKATAPTTRGLAAPYRDRG